MRILGGVFGLVGVLCTITIITIIWKSYSGSLSNTINNTNAQSKDLSGGSESRLLPKPNGIEMQMNTIKSALMSYRLSKGDLPLARSADQSSNQILRQLFRTNPGLSEQSFYAVGSFITTSKPDDISSQTEALGPGENHWAFVRGRKPLDHYANVPILIEPYRPGETYYRQEDYGPGRGVLMIFSDGSIETVPIDAEGHAVKGEKNLLSAEYPGWRGDEPTIFQPTP